jgi:nitroimidazol reductase NimA-like FMN-containing flavoprotein (pyridoxamine 5'-phosphate oxidase superfamily)
VAVSVAALPAIFPVNYAVDDGDIYFFTAPGSRLAAATRHAVVAFEVDHVEQWSHTGWSVLVVGSADEVTDPLELAALRSLPLKRWAAGGPETLIRVRGDEGLGARARPPSRPRHGLLAREGRSARRAPGGDMTSTDALTDLEIVDRDECLRLMMTEEVGRIAFVHGGAAEVLPVNFVLDGDAIVFATAPGAKLSSVERGPVTFEVDRVERATRSGWSVIVHGRAEEITAFENPILVERIRSLPLHPWAGGERTHLLRITPRTITGRRVGGDRAGSTVPLEDDHES